MNVMDILIFMGELGGHFRRSQIESMMEYFEQMIADERFVAIYKDQKLEGFITFSLTNNDEPFRNKQAWQFLQHNPAAETVYIEIMVCRKWNREIRETFERELVEKYPSLTHATWLRDGRSLGHKIIVRRKSCIN